MWKGLGAVSDMFPEVPSVPAPAGDTPSWFTPLPDFLAWERHLLETGLISGEFNLDPCGHSEAPVSREILRRGGVVYTLEEHGDGLNQPWRASRPFLNPPFDAGTMWGFLRRVRDLLEDGGLREVGLHCPAWTDRSWWQQFVEQDRRLGRCDVMFVRGRLTYGYPGNPSGHGGESAMFPSAWVAWGSR